MPSKWTRLLWASSLNDRTRLDSISWGCSSLGVWVTPPWSWWAALSTFRNWDPTTSPGTWLIVGQLWLLGSRLYLRLVVSGFAFFFFFFSVTRKHWNNFFQLCNLPLSFLQAFSRPCWYLSSLSLILSTLKRERKTRKYLEWNRVYLWLLSLSRTAASTLGTCLSFPKLSPP